MGSQSKNTEMVCHQGYALISNAEEAEVGQFYEDLKDLKAVLFIIEDWNTKVGS